MKRIYRATLHGDRLDWIGAPPHQRDGIRVHVTVDDSSASDGERMAQVLGDLAGLQTFSSISDPVAWQREQRQDRLLPGRE